ncbi:enoyl-CoA hydratase/isomerase family protein [Roseomonas sp. AR75]|jgi:enoyl-CoA hydratase/carnithine racemase|uniref:enoyl-CoA hydratase/isomerase family protein n=1 Tax=Roseomonas sp. AR75 TaxID=2562311 RepID=UPI0010C08E1E|nr:enoyl-CoA hydratase/isomerase family protein [Roseomonas sp. AR75]
MLVIDDAARKAAEGHVLATMDGAILVITLNRPERLNAWNAAMRARLVELLQDANADDAIKGVVLTGAGDRAFCAGQDLNEGKTFDGARAEEWIEEWRRLYGTMRRFEKPLVIALNGLAAGSAFQVALLGDIRVGHAGSKMGQPEINSGIVSATGFWIIREMLGLSRAIEMILTGRMAEAEECHRVGLMHHLVPADQVRAKALEIARELAAKPPLAFKLNKQRFCAATQAGFDETFEAARIIHRHAFDAGEPQRVMEAFLGKNKGA